MEHVEAVAALSVVCIVVGTIEAGVEVRVGIVRMMDRGLVERMWKRKFVEGVARLEKQVDDLILGFD